MDLFFTVRDGTKQACLASCMGVIAEVEDAAKHLSNAGILAAVRESVKLMTSIAAEPTDSSPEDVRGEASGSSSAPSASS